MTRRLAAVAPMLRYEEAPPPEPLRPFARSLWAFTVPAAHAPLLHHVPPDGCVSLAVTPGGAPRAVLVGPHVTAFTVPLQPGDRVRGVRMHPEAAGALIGIEPRAWVGTTAPLDAAHPALAAAARGGGVDAAFEGLLDALVTDAAGALRPDTLAKMAAEAIEHAGGDLRIGTLARRLGVSPRTLQRRFAAATGLTPKQYARVRRFRSAVAANVLRVEPEGWGRVAAEYGFADQAHLARECVALGGAPPTAFEVQVRRIEHVGVRP